MQVSENIRSGSCELGSEEMQIEMFWACQMLTPSMPAVPNYCCLKGSVPYWSHRPFLIFDIRALSPECQSAQMSKIKNVGLDKYGIV